MSEQKKNDQFQYTPITDQMRKPHLDLDLGQLYEKALEELALRTLEDPTAGLQLTESDLSLAAQRLLEQENGGFSAPIGF